MENLSVNGSIILEIGTVCVCVCVWNVLSMMLGSDKGSDLLTLILRRSRTGTV